MVTLEKIQSSLFSNLYESFLIDDDPYSGEQEWRTVFDYQFDNAHDYCGYAMLDEGKVVGMLGMVFSERCINGTRKHFCNLHTWWVREDHRGHSLLLLRPLLQLTDYTITHFTPCDTVRGVTHRLGFKDLSKQLRVLLPCDFFPGKRALENTTLTYDLKIIQDRLSDVDRKIFLDHQPYGCGHLLVSDGDESCYLLYTHVIRHRVPYCHVHYISNKEMFAEKNRIIRSSLLKNNNGRYVAVDARLVRNMRFPYSFDFWVPEFGLYRSSDVKPHQIDNLYSDVVFLKLTTLPDMSGSSVAEIIRRLWPFGVRSKNGRSVLKLER